MFERIQGLTPERVAGLTALVQRCRAVLDQGEGMDAVQRLLHDLEVGVIDSILITRELLDEPGNLGQAKAVVLTSAGQIDALRAHQQLVDTIESAQDIAEAAGRLSPANSATTIIAIDGPGGAGKSTLAAAVAELLDDAPIVHGDDFYCPMPEHEREQLDAQQGYQRYFDWGRLRDQVLVPLRAGHRARYQCFDWAVGQLTSWHEVKPGAQVIVEGVYSARPELSPYYHLTTYVDTPREICLQRIQARGQNPEAWIERWRAAEDYYLQTTWPQTRVKLVIRGY
jgi:uridine kinase